MTTEVTITIRIDEDITIRLDNPFASNALSNVKDLLDRLGETSDALRPVQSSAATSSVPPAPRAPTSPRPTAEAPPQAVAATNGHGPKPAVRRGGPRRERRVFTDEQKRAGAARAREVGATKAAEEFDVVPTVVRGWLKKHPKEHAVAEPIVGTPPRVGENREDWEARHRAAAGSAL